MPLLEQVLEQYPQEVKVVFKNFPLSSHKVAQPAAVAALAAMRQGKFWEYHDALFENYNKLTEPMLDELAKKVGLDLERFKTDRNDPQVVDKVRQDFEEGVRAGVRGTPTIFINGRRLLQRSMQGFTAMIDDELRERGLKK